MQKEDFEKLVKKETYQIFLFTCSCPFPIQFAKHSWFVINKKGKLTRWEVVSEGLEKDGAEFEEDVSGANSKEGSTFIHKNFLPPTIAFRKYYWSNRKRGESELAGFIEGKHAKEMIEFIEKNAKKYPFKKEYRYYPGPNSNTFVQWVLNNFPNSGLELPPKAIGKEYKLLKEENAD